MAQVPEKIVPLTNTEVINAKPENKQYRLTDGDSLYLLITFNGPKYWRLDYTLPGFPRYFFLTQQYIVVIK
jgi:hypothetical protein